MPIVWLVGASGVGKSTVGWLLQQALERRGTRTAFVDADQLRNAAGVGAVHDALIAQGLRAVASAFERAGAALLIVAGIADDEAHLARMLPDGARASALVVHLHASDEAVLRRVEQRQWNVELADDSVEYARAFDPAWVDVTIDTTALSGEEVVERLLDRVPADPGPSHADAVTPADAPSSIDAAVTLITGAGGIGVSSVGFMRFLHGAQAGERIGYIDSHQVGFVGRDPRSTDSAPLRARNTVAIAAVMAGHGIEHVVVTGDPATSRALVELARPQSVLWLDASDEALELRHRARAAGGGPPLAGDHRLGLDEAGIRSGIAESIATARDETVRPPGHTVVRADAGSASDTASQIRAMWSADRQRSADAEELSEL